MNVFRFLKAKGGYQTFSKVKTVIFVWKLQLYLIIIILN